MQLRPDRLSQHLRAKLAPVYVLSGDEPLQVRDAYDAIIAAARSHGYADRTVLTVETNFDWDTLRALADSPGLFAQQRIVDLRMPSGKPGDRGGKILRAYAERLPPDDILLITTGRLDRSATGSKWYKTLDSVGVTVQVWPVDARQLPAWIRNRAKAQGRNLTEAAAHLLAERSEGNLLACDQELHKLKLLFDDQTLDVEQVLQAVSDSARFNAFDLLDRALEGQPARVLRVSRGLMEEGAEPLMVLGSLLWALRAMAEFSSRVASGQHLDTAFTGRNAVWNRRKAMVQAALRRHSQHFWLDMIKRACLIDRLIKGRGAVPGQSAAANRQQAWDEIAALTLRISGARIFAAPGL